MLAPAPRPERYTVEEWLNLEQQTGLSYEYLDGFVYAMAGESDAHNEVISNFVEYLRPQARAKGCGFKHSNFRVYIAGLNRYYYPDVAVSCAEEADPYAYASPCLIVEVLSPSTAQKDRREKLDAYTKIPALKTYVLVDQGQRRVEVYERSTWNWVRSELVNEGEFRVDCLDAVLSLEQVYAGLRIAGAATDES
jgi:Uma2 family endonuclease